MDHALTIRGSTYVSALIPLTPGKFNVGLSLCFVGQMDFIADHKHRICVVDDDAAVRDSMRALLESYGYEVRDFDSAAAFLGAPRTCCCLIIDFRMPVTNGLELLELLRMGGDHTPAILMTDKGEPTLTMRIGAASAHAWLIKPIAESELVHTIADACDRCRVARRAARSQRM